MIPLIIIISAMLILLGGILAVRGIIRLYRNDENMKAVTATVFFIFIPLLIIGLLFLESSASKLIWIYLPVVLLVLFWIGGGFALAFSMRKTLKKRLEVAEPQRESAPRFQWLKNLAFTAAAAIIWAFGTFIGFGKLAIVEVTALAGMAALLSAAAYGVWKTRIFTLDNKKSV